jgi:hypothetical protein
MEYKKTIDEALQYIPIKKQEEVLSQIDRAIAEGRFKEIQKDGFVIGFFTFKPKEDSIFINNCVICEKYRNRENLLYLRQFFRQMFNGCTFYWKSKKRGRMAYVK